MGKTLELEDLCVDAVVNLISQFRGLINKNNKKLLEYLWSKWQSTPSSLKGLQPTVGNEESQSPIKLDNHLPYNVKVRTRNDSYNYLRSMKMYILTGDKSLKAKIARRFPPKELIDMPNDVWVPLTDKTSELHIENSFEGSLRLAGNLVMKFKYLDTLLYRNYYPCHIFDHINIDCFHRLKSVQIVGNVASAFSTTDFLTYILGINSNNMKSYEKFKEYSYESLPQDAFDAPFENPQNLNDASARIKLKFDLFKIELQSLKDLACIRFTNLEEIIITSDEVEKEALLLGLKLLSTLKHIQIGNNMELIKSIILYDLLTFEFNMKLDSLKIMKLIIMQPNHEVIWADFARLTRTTMLLNEVQIFEDLSFYNGFLYALKHSFNFGGIEILKINIRPETESFESLISLLLAPQAFMFSLNDLEVKTITLHQVNRLMGALPTYINLNTLRLTVDATDSMVELSYLAPSTITKLHVTMQASDTACINELLYILMFHAGAHSVFLEVPTYLLTCALTERMLDLFSRLNLLCIILVGHNVREIDNFNLEARMQLLAKSILEKRPVSLILDLKHCKFSVSKQDALRRTGWHVDHNFENIK